jgi:hypothetical protein
VERSGTVGLRGRGGYQCKTEQGDPHSYKDAGSISS